ncbi:MAG TPA: SDR family NAD(P)-dependent oxidoreductase [Hyphomicrobium sp.]|jgi:NAD(P)-dependent dehydrogenase (short-subunit alcohol dehydrogenase family)|nr:SDR family NAD(P)-dependent oxidoreductase [Hyphomicrobium sp.]
MAEPRLAIVTGANRGIGLEIVRQLARRGLNVVLASRDLAKGEAAAARLALEGVEVPVIAIDVTDGESVRAGVADVLSRFGRIDVLVNNAAILKEGFNPEDASVFEAPIDLVMLTFATNTVGPLRMIEAIVPGMRERGYGRVVNLSSGAGQLSDMGAGYPAYRMSKAALNALTRLTAAELGPGDIKINAMCPGWVRTDMGGPNATRTVEKGAETAVWLATLPADGPTGGFFRDRKPIPW